MTPKLMVAATACPTNGMKRVTDLVATLAPILRNTDITMVRLTNLPITSLPMLVTATTIKRLERVSICSICCGVKPNLLLMAGNISTSSATSVPMSRPGSGITAAPADTAERLVTIDLHSSRIRSSSANDLINIGLPRPLITKNDAAYYAFQA